MNSSDRLGLTAFRLVGPPRALRKFGLALGPLFLLLPVVLVAVPWQQNVQANGRVTAVDPLDREQTIQAPVTGQLVELNVREGSYVRKGDVLARMADQDPQYSMRLEQQLQLARDKVSAAKDMIEFYEEERRFQESALQQAVSSARFAYNMALDKVRVNQRELEGFEAELDQKRTDRDRKSTLWQKGVVSQLSFQMAEADYLAAQAKVEAAKAKVEQARNEERAKEADMGKIASDLQAKIEKVKSSREDGRSKLMKAETELTDAATKLDRQKTQVVTAPRTGTVSRVHAANTADFLVQGSPLIQLVPETDKVAVELRVRGIDAPLITPGRKVRIQFEGWPAVQLAGWPSVAVGTFGGTVLFVDAQADREGRFRVLVVPDPDDDPWPDPRYLRQGVRANGWCLLDTVSVGYEIWRNLNAFPPSLEGPPDAPKGDGSAGGAKGSKGSKEKP